ncbi:DUF885 domain-containing protein [Labedaea rhizosphaerae]|uniref:DUF885 domain-containing protein n=1 Tax=Labedaea rhizosphaerae TaxID=598644 RepID=UPI001AAD4791|nr:DUF885 family protein [Labedaea rhizosphaerae]
MSTASADERLRALYTEEWDWRVEQFGRQVFDATGPVDAFLPDVGEEARAARRRRWQSTVDQVTAIPDAHLSPAEQTNKAVYLDQLRTLLDQEAFHCEQWPANADTAFWSRVSGRAARVLRTDAEREAYLAQLADLPRHFAQQIANMRAGVARGFGPAKITMRGRDATIRSVAQASSAEETVFYKAFAGSPQAILDAAKRTVTDAVMPAYAGLLEFYLGEYLPALPEGIAASDLPDGREFYRAQLREYTTTTLGPEEIFELGLAEVARIRTEMDEIVRATGFADLPALLHHLRTDPSFYATTPQELLRAAAWHAKEFDGVVHDYFGRVPRMRFGIEEPPADLAPFYTFGRGGAGRYVVNTYDLKSRPLYSLPSLTLHEAAPGHAFQIPFAMEQEHLPQFRRHVYLSAYGEGWALYAERLGVEMGMYHGPFEVMGMLSFQMWRAARLVVDPGIHALGWSRERARQFLRDNTAIAEHEIGTEIDRYIAWPGQATAYHLGQLCILDARRKAEAALGGRFDLRAFHDQVLSLGSVPLTVLTAEVDRFIERGGRSPFSNDA